MSEAKVTLIGFYNYMNGQGDDLFKYLTMPADIDKTVLIDNILTKGGDFEVLYSDPVFTQKSIGVWSHKWAYTFEKWSEALAIEYNPLDNYNRHEDYTDTHTGSGSVDVTTALDTKTIDDSESKQEMKVSAFDSNDYQPKEQNETEYDNTTTVDSDGSSKTTLSDNKTIEHHAHLYGNIGVTTSQQMLRDQLDVVRFNLIDNITDVFLREYTIPIY